jgi:hypothetical protein
MIITPKSETISVRQNGMEVLLLHNGRRVASVPWQHALQLAKAIQATARRAEEIEKHDQVAFDHAIMRRVGAPFGLALNCHVRTLGDQMAAWNSKLRRYLPGGVRSQERLGVPTVTKRGG